MERSANGRNRSERTFRGLAKRGDMNENKTGNSSQPVNEHEVWPEGKERSRGLTICKNLGRNGQT